VLPGAAIRPQVLEILKCFNPNVTKVERVKAARIIIHVPATYTIQESGLLPYERYLRGLKRGIPEQKRKKIQEQL
jgi:hypothetical protein